MKKKNENLEVLKDVVFLLFSVIIPMYNVEDYADKCISSVLSQTFADFELIVVDDGSNDDTPNIIDRFQKQDKRIKVIRRANGGSNSARKAGANEARGDYIVLVDGDDWVERDYLEKSAIIIKESQPDIICYDYYQDINGKSKKINNNYGSLNVGINKKQAILDFTNSMLLQLPPMLWAKIFRRNIYVEQQNKINDIITMGEDGIISFLIFCRSNSVFISKECFYHYRYNPMSMTKIKNKVISKEATLCRINLLDREIVNCSTKEVQISAYCSHAIFNVCLSYFRNTSYAIAKNATKEMLSDKIAKKYMSIFPTEGNKREKIVYLVLKYKLYFLIKLYALYSNRK